MRQREPVSRPNPRRRLGLPDTILARGGCGGRGDGWTTQGFDDSHWPTATQGGLNGASPWGVRPGIGMNAHWIWAHNLQGTDEVRFLTENSRRFSTMFR